MSQYRAVIFDWDGTLVDSLDHIVSSLASAARDCGLPARSDHELRDIIGLGLVEALGKLYPGITFDQMDALRKAYGVHFFGSDTTPFSLYGGVDRLLDELTGARAALAVATGKSRRGLDQALMTTGLEDRFQASRCADETRSKPHPLMLEELLQKFGLAAGEAVMVGDTVYDLEMAAAMGMPSVGVTWGVHDAAALARYNPVRIVNEVSELQAFLLDTVRPYEAKLKGAINE